MQIFKKCQKDGSIKNGASKEERKNFLARIETFKKDVFNEVLNTLKETNNPHEQLDFYSKLSNLTF